MEFMTTEGSPFIFPPNNPPDTFQFGYFQGETIPWTYTVQINAMNADTASFGIDFDVVPVPPTAGLSGSQTGEFKASVEARPASLFHL
jgi:hypothetical protein